MKRLILCFGLMLPSLVSSAQCDACKNELEVKTDYCFTDSRFENACARFIAGESYFFLDQKKKPLQVFLPPKGKNQIEYLLELAANKKLKLEAQDILFIQMATESWLLEERKLGYTFTESGLGIKTIKEGTGEQPSEGKIVKVHYTGYLLDGTKFDSSVDRDRPFEFPLGKGRVIKGWDEGIPKLKVGQKAFLFIPPDLGYGSRGTGPIPANSTLIFEVELLEIL